MIKTTTEIRCDVCGKQVIRFSPSPVQAIHEAMKSGWAFHNGDNAKCPGCAAKAQRIEKESAG